MSSAREDIQGIKTGFQPAKKITRKTNQTQRHIALVKTPRTPVLKADKPKLATKIKAKIVPITMIHQNKIHNVASVLASRAGQMHIIKNDPFELSKDFDTYRAKVARRQAKIAARPRKPYYNPSEEQVAAQKARRAEQAAVKAAKPYIRHAQKVPGIAEHIKPGPAFTVATSTALSLAAIKAIKHNNKKVSKRDNRKRNTALGAVAGVAAADATSMAGGQATKAALKIHRAKVGVSEHDRRVWGDHLRRHGVHGGNYAHASQVKTRIDDKTKYAIHRNYPKSLPGWRVQRALAVKNRPEVYGAALVAGGATGAYLARKHTKVNKGIKPVLLKVKGNPEAIARTSALVVPTGFIAAQYSRKKKPMSKSAFGVDHEEIAKTKAVPGQPRQRGQSRYRNKAEIKALKATPKSEGRMIRLVKNPKVSIPVGAGLAATGGVVGYKKLNKSYEDISKMPAHRRPTPYKSRPKPGMQRRPSPGPGAKGVVAGANARRTVFGAVARHPVIAAGGLGVAGGLGALGYEKKKQTMGKSAFGVDHDEIEKAFGAGAVKGLKQASTAFKSGFKSPTAPGKSAGFSANFGHKTSIGVGHTVNAFKKPAVKLTAIGAGAGGTGYALGNKRR